MRLLSPFRQRDEPAQGANPPSKHDSDWPSMSPIKPRATAAACNVNCGSAAAAQSEAPGQRAQHVPPHYDSALEAVLADLVVAGASCTSERSSDSFASSSSVAGYQHAVYNSPAACSASDSCQSSPLGKQASQMDEAGRLGPSPFVSAEPAQPRAAGTPAPPSAATGCCSLAQRSGSGGCYTPPPADNRPSPALGPGTCCKGIDSTQQAARNCCSKLLCDVTGRCGPSQAANQPDREGSACAPPDGGTPDGVCCPPATPALQFESQAAAACPMQLLREHERYRPLRELSRGAHGAVLLAMDAVTEQRVAVKLVARDSRCSSTAFAQELINQRRCRAHPHVVQLLDVFLLERHLAIVMEYADGGDLAEMLGRHYNSAGTPLPEEAARHLFQQLLVAVDYCHRLGIANRDIKLDNILLRRGEDGLPQIKLCDFGYSIDERHTQPTASCGTPEYIAPEVLISTVETGYKGAAADMWSCGVALYLLLAGGFPFLLEAEECLASEARLLRMVPRIMTADYRPLPAGLSMECQELVHSLLALDPRLRPTAAQCLRHPWVAADMPPALLRANSELLARRGATEPAWRCRQCAASPGGRAHECGDEREPPQRRAGEPPSERDIVAQLTACCPARGCGGRDHIKMDRPRRAEHGSA